MNTEIIYTNFGVTEVKNITVGDYFMWGGKLYQKAEEHFQWEVIEDPEDPQDRRQKEKNVISVKKGTSEYFYDEEAVVPVNIKIEVFPEESA